VTSATIGGQNQPLVFVTGGGDIDISGAVIANASAKLFALNALTGAVLWQTPLGSAPHHFAWSSPVVANNSVYAASHHLMIVRQSRARSFASTS
jgi:outer membrane protein assembly factor BamB